MWLAKSTRWICKNWGRRRQGDTMEWSPSFWCSRNVKVDWYELNQKFHFISHAVMIRLLSLWMEKGTLVAFFISALLSLIEMMLLSRLWKVINFRVFSFSDLCTFSNCLNRFSVIFLYHGLSCVVRHSYYHSHFCSHFFSHVMGPPKVEHLIP